MSPINPDGAPQFPHDEGPEPRADSSGNERWPEGDPLGPPGTGQPLEFNDEGDEEWVGSGEEVNLFSGEDDGLDDDAVARPPVAPPLQQPTQRNDRPTFSPKQDQRRAPSDGMQPSRPTPRQDRSAPQTPPAQARSEAVPRFTPAPVSQRGPEISGSAKEEAGKWAEVIRRSGGAMLAGKLLTYPAANQLGVSADEGLWFWYTNENPSIQQRNGLRAFGSTPILKALMEAEQDEAAVVTDYLIPGSDQTFGVAPAGDTAMTILPFVRWTSAWGIPENLRIRDYDAGRRGSLPLQLCSRIPTSRENGFVNMAANRSEVMRALMPVLFPEDDGFGPDNFPTHDTDRLCIFDAQELVAAAEVRVKAAGTDPRLNVPEQQKVLVKMVAKAARDWDKRLPVQQFTLWSTFTSARLSASGTTYTQIGAYIQPWGRDGSKPAPRDPRDVATNFTLARYPG